mmetsp:Transcript_4308/g.5707  ORF Transcript_4308/g.5707 Transcript_4308/m.5707 type:complete len:330 (-) Transcript_4308:2299-3288(-)
MIQSDSMEGLNQLQRNFHNNYERQGQVEQIEHEVADNVQVIERAFDIFIETAELERDKRNFEKAFKALRKAASRAEKLPASHPKRGAILERQQNLYIRVQLASCNRAEPFSFQLHYVTRHKAKCDAYYYQNYSALVRLVRRKVFCDELNIPEEVELDERDDVSIHILAKIGDAPVAYARVWIRQLPLIPNEASTTATGSNILSYTANWGVIDRFCTLPEYRCRGLGTSVLERATHEILSLNNNSGEGAFGFSPPINMVVVEIPVRQLQIQKKLEQIGLIRLNSANQESPVMYYDTQSQQHRINSVHLAKQLCDSDKFAHDFALAKKSSI